MYSTFKKRNKSIIKNESIQRLNYSKGNLDVHPNKSFLYIKESSSLDKLNKFFKNQNKSQFKNKIVNYNEKK